ncbi:DUF2690 domain-containing protein [Micromonospora endophytica]|uniref:DUF2690 domain-containing protein n=1 Tax=Micromonospora endophytica TaxID=515350 RepID=UPI0015E8C063|nr:DUF2690 domain-containing protein [Micromonospora endophytica]BCJ58019.1 hypothetical protein Jiend_14410 [Micromonospora endophytica]
MKRLLRTFGVTSALAVSLLAAPASAQAAPDRAAEVAAAAEPSAAVMAEIAAGNATMIDEATLAASGCGSSCDGRNPQTYKIYYNGSAYYTCAEDAVVPKSGTYTYKTSSPIGSVELRYSPRCRTAWARTTASYVSFKVDSRYLNGNHRRTESGYTESGGYTLMVNDADLEARACYAASGPISGWDCTRWW